MSRGNALGIPKNPIKVLTGEADVDVSASDYTAYQALLTIANAATDPLEDVQVILDLAKATTGYAAGYTTQTIQFRVARKVDGTNWRREAGTSGGSGESTAITGTNAAGSCIRLDIGTVGPNEDVRIEVVLSAETANDAELPYAIYYKGQTPTITAVAA